MFRKARRANRRRRRRRRRRRLCRRRRRTGRSSHSSYSAPLQLSPRSHMHSRMDRRREGRRGRRRGGARQHVKNKKRGNVGGRSHPGVGSGRAEGRTSAYQSADAILKSLRRLLYLMVLIAATSKRGILCDRFGAIGLTLFSGAGAELLLFVAVRLP